MKMTLKMTMAMMMMMVMICGADDGDDDEKKKKKEEEEERRRRGREGFPHHEPRGYLHCRGCSWGVVLLAGTILSYLALRSAGASTHKYADTPTLEQNNQSNLVVGMYQTFKRLVARRKGSSAASKMKISCFHLQMCMTPVTMKKLPACNNHSPKSVKRFSASPHELYSW